MTDKRGVNNPMTTPVNFKLTSEIIQCNLPFISAPQIWHNFFFGKKETKTNQLGIFGSPFL